MVSTYLLPGEVLGLTYATADHGSHNIEGLGGQAARVAGLDGLKVGLKCSAPFFDFLGG